MKNLKLMLALTLAVTFVITSCNKEELFQKNSTTNEELSSITADNAFMDLVKDDVYPVNLLSSKTIRAFNENLIMLGGQIASANGSVLETDLSQDQINFFFDLLAERNYLRADENVNISVESRFGCGAVRNHIYHLVTRKCKKYSGSWCFNCPID